MHKKTYAEHMQHKKLLKSLEKHFSKDEKEMEDEYPPEHYDRKKVKPRPNEKFYPPYDGERDEYEEGEEINEVSPWKMQGDDDVQASGRTESEASDGRKGKVKRVSETLKRMPKEDRKRMAVVVLSTKMRKRKSM